MRAAAGIFESRDTMSQLPNKSHAASRPSVDWRPPYPAHSALFGNDVDRPVIAYLGCQSQNAEALAAKSAELGILLAKDSAPNYCDRAHFIDEEGCANEVFVGYWLKEADYECWLKASGFADWLRSPAIVMSDVGVWLEPVSVPLSRLETIAGKPDYGLARAAINKGTETRDHAYFGSMRDRIPVAAADMLEVTVETRPIAERPPTRGRVLRVQPPANLAIIRSGQDWTRCAGDELATYLVDVQPKLVEGMDFLRGHPEETGCLSCRYMKEKGADGGENAISFGYAIFLSLECLENWSKEHPTHLAIFDSFHRMIKKHKDARGLRLWHEVCVLGHVNRDFIYVNCNRATGLLRSLAGIAT